MKLKNIAFALLIALGMPLTASADQQPKVAHPQAHTFKLRISLTDKKDCGFSVKKPEAFLSAKSIARRKRFGLKVDEHDLPLTAAYVDRLRQMGLRFVNQSKWANSVVMQANDTLVMADIRRLPFVKDVRCVWVAPDSIDAEEPVNRAEELARRNDPDTIPSIYGAGQQQTEMLNLQPLHEAGYKGKGITIAVIDGGFHNADLVPGLPQRQILGTRNFVRPEKSVYDELSHGMMVLSCIAANEPHRLVGTAPQASFYLLVSEDGESEQMVEQDNWCAAVEYADSLGCDIVTSSLGYTEFDHPWMANPYRDLNGRTAINSRVASLAASRGIVLLNSAGNSGMDSWKKIGTPADATDILTVGALFNDSTLAFFSSIGNTADNRIKPDVVAMGVNDAVYDIDGNVETANGTSFSCPVMCGAVACLMQAYPQATPLQIMEAVRKSGNNAEHPDNIYGYGLPDMQKAFDLLKQK